MPRLIEVKLKELVGSKSKGVFHNMQKAVLSGTLNIGCNENNEYRIRNY